MKRTFCLIATLIFVFHSTTTFSQSKEVLDAGEKLQRLLYFIDELYVDSSEVESLAEDAIRSMLEELDPHSVYYSAEDLKKANEPLNGSFEGIGIQFNILKDTIMVVSPISGGPSEKLGIRAGDKIVEIEGEVVAGVGIQNSDVGKLLKGPKGTKVEVNIKRHGERELIPFVITRDKIPIFSVDASYMVDGEIGYIKINRFARETEREMVEAIDKLKKQGMQKLIIDLQGNGGGYLNTAIAMCDQLLSEDKLIVYTEGRAYPKRLENARIDGIYESGDLVVLIDEGSASASEILSGAVQDWDRGVIVGRRSFGKGLVQKTVDLYDGSAVRLTTQHYYTPSGRCIQKPYDDGVESYRMEKYDRYDSGEMYTADSISFPDSLKFKTMLNERTVYGGGGIMPDIFVGVDTTLYSDYLSDLVRSGALNSYVLDHVDNNRDQLLASYNDADQFINFFEVNGQLMNGLIEAGEAEDVAYDEEGYARSKQAIEVRIKGIMARNLYDNSAFYKVINELDPIYNKGVELLQGKNLRKLDIVHKQYR